MRLWVLTIIGIWHYSCLGPFLLKQNGCHLEIVIFFLIGSIKSVWRESGTYKNYQRPWLCFFHNQKNCIKTMVLKMTDLNLDSARICQSQTNNGLRLNKKWYSCAGKWMNSWYELWYKTKYFEVERVDRSHYCVIVFGFISAIKWQLNYRIFFKSLITVKAMFIVI